MPVDISQVRAFSTSLTTASGRVGAQAAAALKKTAYDIEADAKALIISLGAVDTGNLLNSVTTSISGDGRHGSMTAEVGPTAEYGIYVHEGTSRMGARPFLTTAFDSRAPLLEKAIAQLAERAI